MPARRTVGLVVVLAAVPLGIAAWWLGSPLFLDRTVNEDFPHTARATIPDSMTRAAAERIMSERAAEMSEVAEAMPSGGEAPDVLRRGVFEDADNFHHGSGTATVYRLASGERILRFEEFQVTNGPDLRVVLTGHPQPRSHDDLEAAGYVELARLKGNVGNQNYPIPSDVDLVALRSVVIYCRPFHVVFSTARLAEIN